MNKEPIKSPTIPTSKRLNADKPMRFERLVYDMSLGTSPCYGRKPIIIRDTCDDPAPFRQPFFIDKPE